MKNALKLAVLCFGLVILMGCAGKNAIEGVWKGETEEVSFEFAFFSDFCFCLTGVDKDEYNIVYSKYIYQKEEGYLNIEALGDSIYPVKIKGNTLTFTHTEDTPGGIKPELTKVNTQKAPSDINGGWEGPYGMILGFMHDRVYILDGDFDADYGTYSFQNGSGSISSYVWNYNFSFTIKDDTLTVPEADLTFTRIKR